jgi:hypothetical protein
MVQTYGLGFSPNPEDPVDVLAFVLCPATVFAPGGDDDELKAVQAVLGPMKEEAVRRWAAIAASRRRS